ncbi:MAG TPA: polyamine aminopropyltransferase [Alphaproteobacteria bacterium]|nr:polyamine aminopropyltransferase [Alphaproteobacteria bacterium]
MTRKWFEETLYPDYGQRFLVTRTLYRKKTPFQALEIHETPAFGRVLALDGVCQTTERDEFFYHEMMVHPALLAHGRARKVLIIGGGDGGILEEVLKHRTVTRATMVEIDGSVVEVCKKYLPSICGKAFEDRRTDLVIADGVKYVAETKEKFDVILVDSTDPIGAAEVLFGTDFYAACKRCLTPRGILVTQNGVPFLQRDELATTRKRLRRLFKVSGFLFVPVPTYVGGFMALSWSSQDPRNRRVPRATLVRRFRAARLKTQYYTPDIHCAAFAAPAYLERAASV